jgi:regulator of ribosome biosynthesis
MEIQNNLVNINFDLGILSLFDSNAVKYDIAPGTDEFENNLREQSRNNIKLLIQNFYTLKTKKDTSFENEPDEYKLYDYNKSHFEVPLPAPTTIFPRHKCLPAEKKMTKWEKFALEKGIKKKRRNRMVYDEITKDWVPRWGARSIKKIEDQVDVIRTVKEGEDPKADPFDKKSNERALFKEKQKLREMKNQMASKGIKESSLKTKERGNSKKTERGNNSDNRKKTKKGVSKMLDIAQKSTASMGLFDKKAHPEEPEIKKKRKNNVQPFKSSKEEKQRNLDMLEYVAKVKSGK